LVYGAMGGRINISVDIRNHLPRSAGMGFALGIESGVWRRPDDGRKQAKKWAGWGDCWYDDGRRMMGLF
jgi:hypothetical protein